MAVMVLPKGLRRFFRTSNHIERLNKGFKRRSGVIGVFPNEDSLLRLMGSVLLGRNDAVSGKKAVFSRETYDSLLSSDAIPKLIKLAKEQQQIRAA